MSPLLTQALQTLYVLGHSDQYTTLGFTLRHLMPWGKVEEKPTPAYTPEDLPLVQLFWDRLFLKTHFPIGLNHLIAPDSRLREAAEQVHGVVYAAGMTAYISGPVFAPAVPIAKKYAGDIVTSAGEVLAHEGFKTELIITATAAYFRFTAAAHCTTLPLLAPLKQSSPPTPREQFGLRPVAPSRIHLVVNNEPLTEKSR